MRRSLVLCVCLISLSASLVGQQPTKDQVVSRRAKQAFSIYDSEIRKVNEAMGREAAKVREHLASNLSRARQQAASAGDAEEAKAIAEIETSLDFAVPVMAPSRAYWQHPKGYFHKLAGTDWVEKTPKGEVVLYSESSRTHEFIELSEVAPKGDSPTLVRLYRDKSAFQKPGQKAFTAQFKGEFALPAILR